MFRSVANAVGQIFAHLTNQPSFENAIEPNSDDIVLATTIFNKPVRLATSLSCDDLYLTSGFSAAIDEPERPFQFQVDTEVTYRVVTGTDSYLFQLDPNQTYNMTIDWGDGNVEAFQGSGASVSHTYDTPGIYTISFYGSYPYIRLGVQQGASSTATDNDNQKVLDVLQWGTNEWVDTSYLLNVCQSIASLNPVDTPKFAEDCLVTSMFRGCTNMTTLANLGNWYLPRMGISYLFNFCYVLAEPSISELDVSRVYQFSGTFHWTLNADWNVMDVTGWDVSSGECFDYMFVNNYNFALDLSIWDFSSIVNGRSTFDPTYWPLSWFIADTQADYPLNNVPWSTMSGSEYVLAQFNDHAPVAFYTHDISQWGLHTVENGDWKGFLTTTTWSTELYDTALEYWANSSDTASGVIFGCNETYSPNQQANRDYLTNTLGWTLTDNGVTP